MIIVTVGEPNNVNMGDIWFDPTTKITKKVIGANINTFKPMWSQVQLSTAVLSPSIGDVRVDSVSGVPAMWDGTSWIPAVPTNYHFPPTNPKAGDMWTEPLSKTLYCFWNGTWAAMQITSSVGSLASVTSQRPPPSISHQAGISAPAASSIGFTPNPNTANITIQGPGGALLVKIDTLTGVITYGSGYTPDAAAQVFWRAIVGTSPRFLQSQIETLIQDLKDATTRLAVAEGNVLKFTQAGHKLPEPPKPFDANDSWERAMGIIK